jgi:hypothetical protein
VTLSAFIVFGVLVLLFAVNQYFLRRRMRDDERRNWPRPR